MTGFCGADDKARKAALPMGVTFGALAATGVVIGAIGLITGKFLLSGHRPLKIPMTLSVSLVAVGSADILIEIVAMIYRKVNDPFKPLGWAMAADGKIRPYFSVDLDGRRVF